MTKFVPAIIPPTAQTVSNRPTEACPTCGDPAWKYTTGAVWCPDHGGFMPVTEGAQTQPESDGSRFINPFDPHPDTVREMEAARNARETFDPHPELRDGETDERTVTQCLVDYYAFKRD